MQARAHEAQRISRPGIQDMLCCSNLLTQEERSKPTIHCGDSMARSSSPLRKVLGVEMRKGANLHVQGSLPSAMEPRLQDHYDQIYQQQQQPMPKQTQVSGTRVWDGESSCENAAVSAVPARGCQPVSDDSSDSEIGVLKLEKLPTNGSEFTDSEVDEEVVDLGKRSTAEENKTDAEIGGLQGLLYGTQPVLLEFITKLCENPPNSGISVWNGLRPALVKGVLRYEEGRQFRVLKDLQPFARRRPQGVFLCEDLTTSQTFVLKKVSTEHYILSGLRFLVQHDKSFLPKIYAVYKECNVIWIFEEYIEGTTLHECDWTPAQIVQFAASLLTSCQYLHDNKLAHCDLKLANVMIRDPSQPQSLVIIDFESARTAQDPAVEEGQGHTTTFLPPWFKELPRSKFTPLLTVADLWTVACILVSLLKGSSWYQSLLQQMQQQQQYLGVICTRQKFQLHGSMGMVRSIWAEKTAELVKQCSRRAPQTRRHGSQFCPHCRKIFLNFLKAEGHQILQAHLGTLIAQGVDDPHWQCLLTLMEYLTDCKKKHSMDASSALKIIQLSLTHL